MYSCFQVSASHCPTAKHSPFMVFHLALLPSLSLFVGWLRWQEKCKQPTPRIPVLQLWSHLLQKPSRRSVSAKPLIPSLILLAVLYVRFAWPRLSLIWRSLSGSLGRPCFEIESHFFHMLHNQSQIRFKIFPQVVIHSPPWKYYLLTAC